MISNNNFAPAGNSLLRIGSGYGGHNLRAISGNIAGLNNNQGSLLKPATMPMIGSLKKMDTLSTNKKSVFSLKDLNVNNMTSGEAGQMLKTLHGNDSQRTLDQHQQNFPQQI